ncbi:hypothetical protein [[Haemophilus] ducreyi]|uniref:Uncharacterized protein n=1 Tax=Haemophilus ducreyi (strain 35000HP / ATCC 700724) TaxID=233412 RepID=Q7VKA9_HAEDU|nr:hypothetical protein [[Haemophilus] ducreyi]AAP96723.1 hypothetical protein HD_2014 [[Haemophilus] ducreyi 35000HP]SEW13673.1 hypothetical protein SAMN02983000_1489 [[Haemophilus] ducreyi]VEG82838.1 Uncharacterised protein [[Haemophilus] ducreyi]
MKKIVCIVIIVLALFLFVKPAVQNFIEEDQCLDFGGSYNQQTKMCEK